MTLAKAVRLLETEYQQAEKSDYVRNPLAYALYKVWKIADSEPMPNITPNTQKALNAIGRRSHGKGE